MEEHGNSDEAANWFFFIGILPSMQNLNYMNVNICIKLCAHAFTCGNCCTDIPQICAAFSYRTTVSKDLSCHMAYVIIIVVKLLNHPVHIHWTLAGSTLLAAYCGWFSWYELHILRSPYAYFDSCTTLNTTCWQHNIVRFHGSANDSFTLHWNWCIC